MNNFLTKCNMVIRKTLDFKKGGQVVTLPFLIHIKDIPQDFFEEDKENVLEDYSDSAFYAQRKNIEIKDNHISSLSYVDLKEYTLSFDEKDLEEYGHLVVKYNKDYIFKDHESLYSFLIETVMFNDTDFNLIKLFVYQCKRTLKDKFEDMLVKELDIGSQSEETTEAYMRLRCAFELNKPPIFKENIGKCIEEMSHRELLTQRVYIGRKCELEKIMYDKTMKESRNKK